MQNPENYKEEKKKYIIQLEAYHQKKKKTINEALALKNSP